MAGKKSKKNVKVGNIKIRDMKPTKDAKGGCSGGHYASNDPTQSGSQTSGGGGGTGKIGF